MYRACAVLTYFLVKLTLFVMISITTPRCIARRAHTFWLAFARFRQMSQNLVHKMFKVAAEISVTLFLVPLAGSHAVRALEQTICRLQYRTFLTV